jgi:hypothetical protein
MTTAQAPVATVPAGRRLIRIGVVLTLVGMAFTAVAILPLFTDLELPSAFWALSMITGVGFGLVLLGLLRNGRQRSRLQRVS